MDVLRNQMGKLNIPKTTSQAWQIGSLLLIFILMFIYFGVAFWYSHQYAQYRSTEPSINRLLAIRRQILSSAIDPLYQNTNSITKHITDKTGIIGKLPLSQIALLNWRPLTVRLSGYLGGIYTARDGVFDMAKGIQLSLSRGARSFIFEIDYLENRPCEPVVILRDDRGYMRSLHTGSIKLGCKALAEMAFRDNFDPVIVIIYLRRIPVSTSQQTNYFKAIAASLEPLTDAHLGQNEQGNFHNCRSEPQLFTNPITNYQKKFIVLCNYNTNLLKATPNPKDNLDFWTNARIYVDESGKSSSLGTVTSTVPNGQIAYAQVGASQQLLHIGKADQSNYLQTSSNTFKIALSAVEFTFSTAQLDMLLNTLGIQCVPLDVVSLAAKPEHFNTIKDKIEPTKLDDFAKATNVNDLLSYWTYYGWSRKLIIEGFQDAAPVPVAKPIPGFIIPKVVVPKRPPPSTNSNGGLVSIS